MNMKYRRLEEGETKQAGDRFFMQGDIGIDCDENIDKLYVTGGAGLRVKEGERYYRLIPIQPYTPTLKIKLKKRWKR